MIFFRSVWRIVLVVLTFAMGFAELLITASCDSGVAGGVAASVLQNDSETVWG